MSQNDQHIDSQNLRDDIVFSYKMDRMYFNSLHHIKTSSYTYLCFQIAKIIFLSGIIIGYVQIYPLPDNKFFPPLVSAAALSVIMIFVILSIVSNTRSIAKNLIIAKELDHIVQEPFDPNLRLHVFDDMVSDTYMAKNPDLLDADEASERFLADIIRHYYLVINKDLNVIARFSEVSLFAISVWLAVLLGIKQIQTTYKVLIICYISVEFFILWKIVAIAIVVAVSPIILLLVCCIALCCKPKSKKDFIQTLNPIQYRESVQLQHGVECLICFTNFYPEEKICILECPAKHAFHEICIKAWFQVGSTCPVCRYDFANDENI